MVARPLQWIAEAPYFLTDWSIEFFASRNRLQEKNSKLENQILKLSQGSQRLAALEAENARLRTLLGSRERLSEDRCADVEGLGTGKRPHHDGFEPGIPDQE